MFNKYCYNLGYAFEEIVENFPNNIAIAFSKDKSFTYTKLNKIANKISRYLVAKNVTQGDVVCISGIKIIETFASMLACIKIGAAYCILDPESPFERLKKIINNCQPKIILVDDELKAKLKSNFLKIKPKLLLINCNHFHKIISTLCEKNLEETKKITSTNSAYIMFTSGSTGFPKGAVISHQNVLNLIQWSKTNYQTSHEDVFTNVNPLYFDNSVFDFYSSLFIGACLVAFTKEEMKNPVLIIRKTDELKCTTWFSVPSLLIYLNFMKTLHKGNMLYIKRFIFGGEGYPINKLKALYDIYGDRSELFNVYGPTECTCICSSYKIKKVDLLNNTGFPPLGKIAKNFSYKILDENSKPVKKEEIGELCLLGPNVSLGYFNDPERTKNSFVQNVENFSTKELMYKTGDLVKLDENDQNLYFCGRKDNQIKHMGYRIELEEVETAINILDYVKEVVVFHGEKRGFSEIVAVITLSSSKYIKNIDDDIRQLIPSYMMPTRFVFKEGVLPKNPSGKIDRIFCKTL